MTNKVLMLVPMKRNLNRRLKWRCFDLIAEMVDATEADVTVVIDHSGGDGELIGHVKRANHIAWIRHNMICRHLGSEHPTTRPSWDYVFWLDADILSARPLNMIDILCDHSEHKHVVAPAVLITQMGMYRWYDTAGFVHHGRRASPNPPYWDKIPGRSGIVELDGSVGCVYLVPAQYYSCQIEDFLPPNDVFTEHFPICAKARRNGGKLIVDLDMRVDHAYLPLFGEMHH